MVTYIHVVYNTYTCSIQYMTTCSTCSLHCMCLPAYRYLTVISGGGGRRAKFYWGMSQIQLKATPLEFSYRESINYIPRLSRILLRHLLHSVLLSATQLGSDELCIFSGLIFYSFILKNFTYYSFYPAHYSLIGASVSEPHLGSSTRPLSVCQSVCLYIYIIYYIYHTSVIFGPAAPALRANVSRLI